MDSEKLKEEIMSENKFPLYLNTWNQVIYKILELHRTAKIDAIALTRLAWFRIGTWRRFWYMVHSEDVIWRIMNNHAMSTGFEISRFCLIIKKLYVDKVMLRVLVVVALSADEDIGIEQAQ